MLDVILIWIPIGCCLGVNILQMRRLYYLISPSLLLVVLTIKDKRLVVKQELSSVLRSAIGPDQFAYKKGCNTTLALLTCHHHWLKWLDGAMDFVRVFSFDFS